MNAPSSKLALRNADIIARKLYDAGVRYAFGIPGGEVLVMLDALKAVGIDFILARHENAAGFMAEASFHMTGAPAVLLVTVGPGVANGVNAIANAAQERVPMIIVSGRVDEAETLAYSHQIFDHQAVLRPLVKASFEARAGACGLMTDKAIHIATDPRPGPVHIDLPMSVAKSAVTEGQLPSRASLSPVAPVGGDLAKARALYKLAKRPVVLAGHDVLREQGGPETLEALCRHHDIPVVTSYHAKGVIDEHSPLSLGGHGLSPKSDAIILPFIEKADLVICVGYDPIEMRAGWQHPWQPKNAIEFVAAADDQFMHATAYSWVCDPVAGLQSLLEGQAQKQHWPNGEATRTREELADHFAPQDGWNAASVLHLLNDLKPDDAIVTADSGAHRILASQILQFSKAGRFLQSSGLCTMGCGLPLATGAALTGTGDEPVICIIGDGCLDMTMGELTTLRDLMPAIGRPVIILVMNDSSLALIEKKQRAEGLTNAGVDLGFTDYAALACCLGGQGSVVDSLPDLRAALTAAFANKSQYSLIDARLPAAAYDGLI